MPRKPLSDKQLAANRANAARSTGPRSLEGKARASQNARKHSFTPSTFAVVRLEAIDELAKIRADCIAVYQPVNSQELFAVERMALAQHSYLRASRLEAGMFSTALNETIDGNDRQVVFMNDVVVGDGDIEVTRAQNRNYCIAEGIHRMSRYSNSFTLFLRYQAQAERLYRRSVEEFDRLKHLRKELPNEPVCDPDPPEKEDLIIEKTKPNEPPAIAEYNRFPIRPTPPVPPPASEASNK